MPVKSVTEVQCLAPVKTAVWPARFTFVKTGPTTPEVGGRGGQLSTALGALRQEPGAKPGAGGLTPWPHRTVPAPDLSHPLPQHTYVQKLHKSVFIYLHTITVYYISCQSI